MPTSTSNPEDVVKQTFCPDCGGIKTVVVSSDGGESRREAPPREWMDFGIASDAGCICSTEEA